MTPSTAEPVRIGGFVLRDLGDGKVWIGNEAGEGMETSAAKIEPFLKGLWNAEF